MLASQHRLSTLKLVTSDMRRCALWSDMLRSCLCISYCITNQVTGHNLAFWYLVSVCVILQVADAAKMLDIHTLSAGGTHSSVYVAVEITTLGLLNDRMTY